MKSSSVQLLQSVVEPLLDNIFVRPPTDHYMTKKNAQLKTFIEPLPPKPKTLTLKAFVPEMSKSFASTLWHYRWLSSYTHFVFCGNFHSRGVQKRSHAWPMLGNEKRQTFGRWRWYHIAHMGSCAEDPHQTNTHPWWPPGFFCCSLHNLVSIPVCVWLCICVCVVM